MLPNRFALAALLVMSLAGAAVAQTPPPQSWPSPLPVTAGEPEGPVVATGLPDRPVPMEPLPPPPQLPGQQHWVSLNLSVLQPFVGRVGVKVWPRPNDSVWVEAYAGSVLFDFMYGFGARVQHTARVNGRGDALMLGPGLGVHVIPVWHWYDGDSYSDHRHRGSLVFLAADVDISWLHDFGDHCGYEVGVKLGVAAKVAGTVGGDYPRAVMFGPDVYPIFNVYSGLRF